MRGKYYYNDASEEKELVKKTMEGDPVAFTPLFHKYKAIFFGNIRKQYGEYYTIDEIQDMSMEFLGKISTKLYQYNPDKAQFSTWITAAMRNFMVDCYRKKIKIKKTKASLDGLPDVFKSKECTLSYIERKAHRNLIKIMEDSLGKEDAMLFNEIFIKGRPRKEVANQMGIKRSTFAYRLERLKRRLYKFKPREI